MSYRMKANLGRRISLLEAKAKPRMISPWIDFVLWLDDHEGDDGKLEVSPNREFQELVEMASPNRPGLHGDVNDRFRHNSWRARQAQSGSYAV